MERNGVLSGTIEKRHILLQQKLQSQENETKLRHQHNVDGMTSLSLAHWDPKTFPSYMHEWQRTIGTTMNE